MKRKSFKLFFLAVRILTLSTCNEFNAMKEFWCGKFVKAIQLFIYVQRTMRFRNLEKGYRNCDWSLVIERGILKLFSSELFSPWWSQSTHKMGNLCHEKGLLRLRLEEISLLKYICRSLVAMHWFISLYPGKSMQSLRGHIKILFKYRPCCCVRHLIFSGYPDCRDLFCEESMNVSRNPC